MSNPPEPPSPHRLRVSDADREQAAEVLRQAAGDGRINFEELDERLGAAYAAKTYGDLAEVTADLPGSGPQPPAVAGAAAVAQAPGSFPASRIGAPPGAGASIAVMSGVERAGPWVLPPRHTVFAMMGGVTLDLREARFSEREVTIDVLTIMGGVDIIVGEDIEVEVGGFGFMGAFEHRAAGPGLPGAPRLRVVGFALMGGVNVQRRGPSKKQRRRAAEPGGRDSTAELGSRPSAAEPGGRDSTAELGSRPSTAELGSRPSAAEPGGRDSTAELGSRPSAAEPGGRDSTAELGSRPSAAEPGGREHRDRELGSRERPDRELRPEYRDMRREERDLRREGRGLRREERDLRREERDRYREQRRFGTPADPDDG